MNKADTCRLLVEPKIRDAGWEMPPYSVLSQPVIALGRNVLWDKKVERNLLPTAADEQRPIAGKILVIDQTPWYNPAN